MRIRDLPLDERLRLVEDIWDSIAEEQEALPISEAQRRALDKRLETYRLTNDRGVPAAEAIERIRAEL